jgi:hypothetical protein
VEGCAVRGVGSVRVERLEVLSGSVVSVCGTVIGECCVGVCLSVCLRIDVSFRHFHLLPTLHWWREHTSFFSVLLVVMVHYSVVWGWCISCSWRLARQSRFASGICSASSTSKTFRPDRIPVLPQ